MDYEMEFANMIKLNQVAFDFAYMLNCKLINATNVCKF